MSNANEGQGERVPTLQIARHLRVGRLRSLSKCQKRVRKPWTPGTPPPNARVIQSHPFEGTVSREAVRAAVLRLKENRA